jgi:hypothetical protein
LDYWLSPFALSTRKCPLGGAKWYSFIGGGAMRFYSEAGMGWTIEIKEVILQTMVKRIMSRQEKENSSDQCSTGEPLQPVH